MDKFNRMRDLVGARGDLTRKITSLSGDRQMLDRDIVSEMVEQNLTDALQINWTRLGHIIQ